MRYLRLVTIAAAILSFGLTLGAAPQPAEAGKVCKKLNLSNNCIVSNDVKNNNLRAKDLKDEAGADFVEFASGGGLSTTDKTHASITVVAPRPGVIIASASGWFDFGSVANRAHCALTTGLTVLPNFRIMEDHTGDLAHDEHAFGITRGFQVAAGSTTINFVCWALAASGVVEDPAMTAMYFPTRY